jgi:NIMA (never in mitosis gene a)-related kinase
VLDLSSRLGYSPELASAIRRATRDKREERPDPLFCLQEVLKPLMKASGFTTHIPEAGDDELPPWATKVHEYHSKEPLNQNDR